MSRTAPPPRRDHGGTTGNQLPRKSGSLTSMQKRTGSIDSGDGSDTSTRASSLRRLSEDARVLVSEPSPLSMDPVRFCIEVRLPLFRGSWFPVVPPWSRRGGGAVLDILFDFFYLCFRVRHCFLLFMFTRTFTLTCTFFLTVYSYCCAIFGG
jgi:hypothetical protein